MSYQFLQRLDKHKHSVYIIHSSNKYTESTVNVIQSINVASELKRRQAINRSLLERFVLFLT